MTVCHLILRNPFPSSLLVACGIVFLSRSSSKHSRHSVENSLSFLHSSSLSAFKMSRTQGCQQPFILAFDPGRKSNPNATMTLSSSKNFQTSPVVFGYKKRGESCSQCQNRTLETAIRNNLLRREVSSKTCWTGRLDPMAEGLMVFLCGKGCANQKIWNSMIKKYRFRMLLGVTTDTYDSFGLVQSIAPDSLDFTEILRKLKHVINFTSNRTLCQPYPPFSSIDARNASGYKQRLWKWSLQNRLHEITTIPSKNVTIFFLKWISTIYMTKQEILRLQYEDADAGSRDVSSTFRIDDIKRSWNESLSNTSRDKFPVLTLEASVSSGCYIRSICSELGKKVGTGGLALSIVREKIGPYSMKSVNVGFG